MSHRRGDPHSHTHSHAWRALRYVGYTPLSINMICLLFPSHPSSLRFCQLWPLMCSAWCVRVRNSCQGTPCLLSIYSAALILSSLTANKFHATLCEPAALFFSPPNNASALPADDISVAFSGETLRDKRAISCQETHLGY